ncbi:Pentatricopeptide repeat-containing protein [Platanthera guangdongensis]|uniref:Pentatricopeptide repeat-containing protein n=1 Tax=Platanthera guangdongensis TaxID=2320717 RepID=A0ABR2MET0_9ASPA
MWKCVSKTIGNKILNNKNIFISESCIPQGGHAALLSRISFHARFSRCSNPSPVRSRSTAAPILLHCLSRFTLELFKLKWHDVGSNLTDAQEHAISQLPSAMTKRSKAVMRHIVCFSHEGNLFNLLALWVKAMHPKRCEWLSVLKELKRMEISLFFEAMEFALTEESFEANVRDYTKLIDTYTKHHRLQDAQTAFQSMKTRGFPCDQVTLTVLVNMYSRAGDLRRAQEAFEDLKLLRSPPDKRAYGSMVMAYVRAGNLNLAESLLKEMEAEEVFAGSEVYKAMLRAFSMDGDAGGAQRVFDAIQFAGIVPDCKLCALLVNAYCIAGNSDGARSTVENMRAAGLEPNAKCVALMLGSYRRENKLEKALSFLMELERDGVAIEAEAAEVLAQWLRQLGVAGELDAGLSEFLAVKGARKVDLW